MDNNPVNQEANNVPSAAPVSNPVQPLQTPQTTPISNNSSKRKMLVALLIVIVLLVLGVTGVYLYLQKTNVYDAGKYNYGNNQTKLQPTVSPTPFVYKVNPNNTSDQAIDSDNQNVSQDLGNLNSDLTNIDQSLNDQQTNLQ